MQDKKDEMVGYVETPTLNLRFSLSKQDIEIISKNMTRKGSCLSDCSCRRCQRKQEALLDS